MIIVFAAELSDDSPQGRHILTKELLKFACRTVGVGFPEICVGKHGKPRDANNGLLFSLSHDGTWGAVALKMPCEAEGEKRKNERIDDLSGNPKATTANTDGSGTAQEIGTDIFRSCLTPAREEKVRRRFLKDFSEPKPLAEPVRLILCRHNGDGFSISEERQPTPAPASFARDFMLTEAILKAEGGGFTSLGRLEELTARTRACAYVLPDGYGVAAAVYTKEDKEKRDV